MQRDNRIVLILLVFVMSTLSAEEEPSFDEPPVCSVQTQPPGDDDGDGSGTDDAPACVEAPSAESTDGDPLPLSLDEGDDGVGDTSAAFSGRLKHC